MLELLKLMNIMVWSYKISDGSCPRRWFKVFVRIIMHHFHMYKCLKARICSGLLAPSNSSFYPSFLHAPVLFYFFCTIMASKSARSLSSASISAMIGLKYGLSSSGLVCSLAGSS